MDNHATAHHEYKLETTLISALENFFFPRGFGLNKEVSPAPYLYCIRLLIVCYTYLFRSRFLGGWSAAARSEIEILFFDWKRFCKINNSFENNLAIRVCFHFCCVKLRRRPHSPCYAPAMLCVHTTPEKFLITQQSLIILGLCLRKIRGGKLHCFRKHRVQNVFRQHRHNAKRRLDFRRSLVSGLPSPRSRSAFGGGARAHFPNSCWLSSLRKAAFSNFSGLKSSVH